MGGCFIGSLKLDLESPLVEESHFVSVFATNYKKS